MRVLNVVVGLIALGMAQVPATPPMKLGLWEINNSGTMMMDGMAMQSTPPTKARMCLTDASWKKILNGSDRQTSCTFTKETLTSTSYSYDIRCPKNNMSGHSEMVFTGVMSETGHGKVHFQMEMNGKKMAIDSIVDARYISSDCGGLTPGQAVVVH